MLLISHRLASVVGADQIVVLADGAVAESGTHDELVARGGTYAALWGAQQELESLGAEGAVA